MDKLLRNKKAIIFFIAPAFLLFTFVLFIPICQSLYYSLCNYDALTKPEFIGFENYRQLFLNDKTMRIALKNSLFFMVFSCVTQLLMDVKGFINLPMKVIAFVALWQYVGQSMMLYMAQISGIDKSLYEASYIDGATKMQSFLHITLPLIRPMVATAMSLNLSVP